MQHAAVGLPVNDQEPVSYPPIKDAAGNSLDLGVSRAQYAAALGQCNTRIVKGNEWNARLRSIYADPATGAGVKGK